MKGRGRLSLGLLALTIGALNIDGEEQQMQRDEDVARAMRLLGWTADEVGAYCTAHEMTPGFLADAVEHGVSKPEKLEPHLVEAWCACKEGRR